MKFVRRLSQKQYFSYVYKFPIMMRFPYINRISYTIIALQNLIQFTMVSEVKVSQRTGVKN